VRIRLPVAPERREGFEAATLRARFSLELMEHGRTTFRRSGSRGLEVLRRFEAEAGFYAASQAPLERLRYWARPALQALWFPWELEGGQASCANRRGAAGYGVLAVAVASPLATWLDGGTLSSAPKVGIDPVPCLNQ